jgi:hypothetical protein
MCEQIRFFLIGGFACAVTTFLIASYLKSPESLIKRFEYALLSGVGAFALCWLANKYFPEKFEVADSIPYSILIGFLGVGKVIDKVGEHYGIKSEAEKIDNEQKDKE